MLAGNGKLFSFDKIETTRKKVSIRRTILDVVIFLLTSLGYIIQVSELRALGWIGISCGKFSAG